jgi:EAL domain-containing protein (putative c-di-GMP-specific phosphodiesterase class I)
MEIRDERPLVDLAEAVREGWLQLWYQPKIDAQAIIMRGVEGLLRVHHPLWGTLSPTFFIATDGDPRLRSVSETVIRRAIDDWYRFFGERGPIEIAINLPIAFLKDGEALAYLAQALPTQPDFERLVVEINGTDIVRNAPLARKIVEGIRPYKIALSVDDVGVEWTSLTDLREFLFTEVKVDQSFIHGCAYDLAKQSMCRRIIELAHGAGARTVAEGVETWADLLATRELGFDLVQGFLFAEPITAEQLARTCWAQSRHCVAPVSRSEKVNSTSM